MARTWKALILVVGLAVVSCLARRHPSYDDIVAKALKFYNEVQQGRPLFRLLESTPPPRNSTSRIPLNFRIKETVCVSAPERQPRECAFREDGEERTCIGELSRRRLWHFLTFTCDRDCQRDGRDSQVPRVRRSAEFPEAEKVEDPQVPPAARDLYEKAKYDIINNILSNF
ncbi:15 kDa protein A [Castor canadensis]|uniref:15 kDa protein A-like n=1 Tax=Castor canadensis TaxID=51338 RepID=A0A250YAY5_CASCN|nr:15 kDa protein A-like [Castor canadensis]